MCLCVCVGVVGAMCKGERLAAFVCVVVVLVREGEGEGGGPSPHPSRLGLWLGLT